MDPCEILARSCGTLRNHFTVLQFPCWILAGRFVPQGSILLFSQQQMQICAGKKFGLVRLSFPQMTGKHQEPNTNPARNPQGPTKTRKNPLPSLLPPPTSTKQHLTWMVRALQVPAIFPHASTELPHDATRYMVLPSSATLYNGRDNMSPSTHRVRVRTRFLVDTHLFVEGRISECVIFLFAAFCILWLHMLSEPVPL